MNEQSDVKNVLAGIFKEHRGVRGELIELLQAVQGKLGYLPYSAMLDIARFTKVPESQVFGAATFYAQFRFTPVGKRTLTICRGTACHVRGAPKILDEAKKALGVNEGETTPDLEYTLETVACVGCCALAPVAVLAGEVHGQMNRKKVVKLLGKKPDDGGE